MIYLGSIFYLFVRTSSSYTKFTKIYQEKSFLTFKYSFYPNHSVWVNSQSHWVIFLGIDSFGFGKF